MGINTVAMWRRLSIGFCLLLLLLFINCDSDLDCTARRHGIIQCATSLTINVCGWWTNMFEGRCASNLSCDPFGCTSYDGLSPLELEPRLRLGPINICAEAMRVWFGSWATSYNPQWLEELYGQSVCFRVAIGPSKRGSIIEARDQITGR